MISMRGIPATLPTLDGVDLAGKRVLLRVDYNIPGDLKGMPLDDWRLATSIPTLRRLLDAGARVGILSHRGRPQGRPIPELSLEPLVPELSRLLGKSVTFVPDCIGRSAEYAMDKLPPGEALLFENTRFHAGEQLNQQPFVQKLAALGDVFVNDAFACAHRAHASTSGLASAMPVSVVGDLMLQELRWLNRALRQAERPVLMILGGDNVSAKLEMIAHIMGSIDTLMLGGPVGLTFLAARDVALGQSMVDYSCVEPARELLAEAGVVGCRLHLPKDVVVAQKDKPTVPSAVRDVLEIGEDEVANDVGPQTLQVWSRLVEEARTVIWIGSLSTVDGPDFSKGALHLAGLLAKKRDFSLLGGNRLVRSLPQEMRQLLPAISTGVGSLMVALMEQSLPPLAVLGMRAKGGPGVERRARANPLPLRPYS